MTVLAHDQGYDMPTDYELIEDYPGEGREIILQSFIDEGMYSRTAYAVDTITEEDIELDATEWLSAYEIEQLQAIEKNASESFWDAVTAQTLTEAIQESTEHREAA